MGWGERKQETNTWWRDNSPSKKQNRVVTAYYGGEELSIRVDKNNQMDKIRVGTSSDYINIDRWLRQRGIEEEDFYASVSPTPQEEPEPQEVSKLSDEEKAKLVTEANKADATDSMIAGTQEGLSLMMDSEEVAGETVESAPEGIIGLQKRPAPEGGVREWDESDEALQQMLVDAGEELPKYGVDGLFGDETETALMKFQAHHGLESTGVVDEETYELLRKEKQ